MAIAGRKLLLRLDALQRDTAERDAWLRQACHGDAGYSARSRLCWRIIRKAPVWIKLAAQADGSSTVTNGRNNFSKTYKR